jgi:hypothetical protein
MTRREWALAIVLLFVLLYVAWLTFPPSYVR